MSQYDFGTIDPDAEDGTELAALLGNWRDAVHSSHRGNTRPAYVVAGMMWVKTVSGTVEQLYYYDGANDLLLATINPTTHSITIDRGTLPAADTGNAGAVVLSDTTGVLTGTDAGKALTADALAALWEDGGNVAAISSGVVTLGEGGSFNLITSAATITKIQFATAKTGRRARIRFNTIRQLTNSADLVIPGAANITTAVGDNAEVEDRGGGTARINEYTRADGTALVAPPPFVPRGWISPDFVYSNNPTTPNTKIDYSAGQVLADDNATLVTLSGGTVNLATTGADALDTGTLANSTPYWLWALAKPDGTTCCVGSLSRTAPTMPSGYTIKRRAGAIFVDSAGHVAKFVQLGRWFWFDNDAAMLASNAYSTTSTSATIGLSVLPTGKRWPVKLKYSVRNTVGGANAQFTVFAADRAAQSVANGGNGSPNTTGYGTTDAYTSATSAQVAVLLSANAAEVDLSVAAFHDDGL